jgi:hypothetical protein
VVHERVHRWFWFTAVGSVLPLLIYAVILVTRGRWAGVSGLIERGELFLIGSVLMATSIGDLLASDTHMKRTKMFVGAMAMGLGGVSAVWYAIILDCVVSQAHYSPDPIIYCSPIIFGATLVTGLACVMLSTGVNE